MDTLFMYYGFLKFTKDESGMFHENRISFSHIKEDYYLIFEEQVNGIYNLYLAEYNDKLDIGKKNPLGMRSLVSDFKKDTKEHRAILQRYLDYV